MLLGVRSTLTLQSCDFCKFDLFSSQIKVCKEESNAPQLISRQGVWLSLDLCYRIFLLFVFLSFPLIVLFILMFVFIIKQYSYDGCVMFLW